MTSRKKRIDTGGSQTPLTDNPFADLQKEKYPGCPDDRNASEAVEPNSRTLAREWQVARTRKGGFNVAFEKRPNGKKVTLVRGVTGDTHVLLKSLKQRCGCGGAVRSDTIELQGDHRDAVSALLLELGA